MHSPVVNTPVTLYLPLRVSTRRQEPALPVLHPWQGPASLFSLTLGDANYCPSVCLWQLFHLTICSFTYTYFAPVLQFGWGTDLVLMLLELTFPWRGAQWDITRLQD